MGQGQGDMASGGWPDTERKLSMGGAEPPKSIHSEMPCSLDVAICRGEGNFSWSPETYLSLGVFPVLLGWMEPRSWACGPDPRAGHVLPCWVPEALTGPSPQSFPRPSTRLCPSPRPVPSPSHAPPRQPLWSTSWIREAKLGSVGLPSCTPSPTVTCIPHEQGAVLVTAVSLGPRAVPGTQQGAQQVLVEQMSDHEASGGTGTFPDSLPSVSASTAGSLTPRASEAGPPGVSSCPLALTRSYPDGLSHAGGRRPGD